MKEKRDETIILRLSKTEKNRIYEKMLSMGIRSLSAYIRKMALDGYCLNLDLPQLRRMSYLRCLYNKVERQVFDMRFIFKMIVFPFWLLTAFLALMLKWTLNLSAFVLALPMLYIFGCGLYTLYCREWLQFLILLVAEFGCFVLIFMGALIADAAERFSGWVAVL